MLKKDVITEENIICNVSANYKNASERFQKDRKNKKINFKCNFENDLKFLRKRGMHKTVVGKINIKSINLILSW